MKKYALIFLCIYASAQNLNTQELYGLSKTGFFGADQTQDKASSSILASIVREQAADLMAVVNAAVDDEKYKQAVIEKLDSLVTIKAIQANAQALTQGKTLSLLQNQGLKNNT